MTIAVDLGRKTTKQTKNMGSNLARGKILAASIGSVDSLYPSYTYIHSLEDLHAVVKRVEIKYVN